MTREEMQKKLLDYQQQLSKLASQLICQHPEGAKLFGKIEILSEILRESDDQLPVAE